MLAPQAPLSVRSVLSHLSRLINNHILAHPEDSSTLDTFRRHFDPAKHYTQIQTLLDDLKAVGQALPAPSTLKVTYLDWIERVQLKIPNTPHNLSHTMSTAVRLQDIDIVLSDILRPLQRHTVTLVCPFADEHPLWIESPPARSYTPTYNTHNTAIETAAVIEFRDQPSHSAEKHTPR